jgi:hypothetical protein
MPGNAGLARVKGRSNGGVEARPISASNLPVRGFLAAGRRSGSGSLLGANGAAGALVKAFASLSSRGEGFEEWGQAGPIGSGSIISRRGAAGAGDAGPDSNGRPAAASSARGQQARNLNPKTGLLDRAGLL